MPAVSRFVASALLVLCLILMLRHGSYSMQQMQEAHRAEVLELGAKLSSAKAAANVLRAKLSSARSSASEAEAEAAAARAAAATEAKRAREAAAAAATTTTAAAPSTGSRARKGAAGEDAEAPATASSSRIPCGDLGFDGMLTTTSHFPKAQPYKPDPQWAEAAEAVHQAQHPDPCPTDYRLTQFQAWEWGFGSLVNSLVKPMQAAFKAGRTLVSPNLWIYSDTDRTDGFTEMFQPLSSCEAPVTIMNAQSMNCESADTSGGHWRLAPCAFTDLRDDGLHTDESYTKHGAEVLPAKYRERGLFWWVSQLLAYVTRPSDTFAAKLAARKKKLGFDEHGPLLGLHVRLGDSCNDIKRKARKCNTLEDYMPYVRKMVAAYGFKAVFLATDNAAVIADTAKYPEMTWLYNAPNHQSTDNTDSKRIKSGDVRKKAMFSHDNWANCRQHKAVFRGWLTAKAKAKSGHAPELHRDTEALCGNAQTPEECVSLCYKSLPDVVNRVRLNQANGMAMGEEALMDLLLLRDTDALVGKFSSNVDRLAISLITARRGGCVPPFVSLDWAWCFDFAKRHYGEGGTAWNTTAPFTVIPWFGLQGRSIDTRRWAMC